MKTLISLAQMNLTFGDSQANFGRAVQMIGEAARRHSDCILFPELWSSGYDFSHAADHAEKNRAISSELSALAKQNRMWIGGSLLEEQNEKLFNSFTLFAPDGMVSYAYQKIHLFRLMDEHHWFQPGNHLQAVDLPWGKAGMAICYDLRFPEIFRSYALEGCRIILMPAEWPLVRVNHWKVLLRARSIENQMFMAAVNCVGKIGNEQFGGSSAVINPWGETVVEGNDHSEELITAEVDLDEVTAVREKIPVFTDRRPDIYQ
jgi:omega-amidase